jgi:hypothetical protein
LANISPIPFFIYPDIPNGNTGKSPLASNLTQAVLLKVFWAGAEVCEDFLR